MSGEVQYNGYTFNDYSHVTVRALMVEDEAARTVLYHRYAVRVQTTIYAESGETYAGENFRRMRQLLTKQGQNLRINHAGFGPLLNINSGSGGVRDVEFGPKPKILEWEPVGMTNAVEVIWECEFAIPTCDGSGGARFDGISSLNYSVGYRVDKMGYTTRTVAGYIEIAMTRIAGGRQIPDTADAYRDAIAVPSPANFERETSWQLSLDKRRLDFTIIDSEIRSANKYPPGVVTIRANHRVGWSRRHMATLPNVISASITLVPGIPRGMAWEIFKTIAIDRISYASGNRFAFLEALEVDEELYGEGTISFQLAYKVMFGQNGTEALAEIFSSTGIFQPTQGDWQAWKAEVEKVQTYRGIAELRHNATEDQIVDLCANDFLASYSSGYKYPNYPATPYARYCNRRPPPDRSYIRFEGALHTNEDNPSVEQITMGKDDLVNYDFDPSEPAGANGQTDSSANIKRFIESAPANLEFVWEGYAERVGYDIPRPGKIKFGNVTLVRKGKGEFRKRYIGRFFCQPVYAAGWRLKYVVDQRPASVNADDADPINTNNAGGGAPIVPPGGAL